MSVKSVEIPFLQKALESAQTCFPADKRLERIELRKNQLEQARKELASVLPVEGIAGREVIQQRIELLERTIEDPTFEERYQCLSMEVLRWRDKQGFPRLAPFSLTDPVFSLEAEFEGYSDERNWKFGGSVAKLPGPMMNIYVDILEQFCEEMLKIKSQEDMMVWRNSITSRFSGVIPQWVREKIHQATADFAVSTQRVEIKNPDAPWPFKRKVTKINVATNIFLIAEVDKWVVGKEVVLRQDPLVVGYKAGCLWLICSFDETPLEKYVRMEFTS